MQITREKEHRRNYKLETLLRELNDTLWISEKTAISEYGEPQFPILLVVGCARSGSTLLMQWLSDLGIFCYPSNLISRFYKAPYIGALIQKMLTDPKFAFADELKEFKFLKIDYKSNLGKTKGVLSPHIFLYFWRRFFNYGEIQKLDESALESIDHKTFLSELAALESVFDKPLALKAMIMNWEITYLNKIFSKFIFLHIKRDPLQNAQSLLRARKDFYGIVENWYSYKPPEYPFLKELNPYEQVAGQIYFTNKAISEQLSKIKKDQWLEIDYSSFCNQPESYYSQLLSKLKQMYEEVNIPYSGPEKFEESKSITLNNDEIAIITNKYKEFNNFNSDTSK